ncbi:unnamed protein product [Dovyalis caffra]|uniref:Uncharacterized protein n=1 Tax=Dovyalis caffra TaxID=77055 RepID=A0AAV1RXY5_9ROSI|nr:unnamed protein product [Dovyalis caffra]
MLTLTEVRLTPFPTSATSLIFKISVTADFSAKAYSFLRFGMILRTSERTLDASDVVDDFCLNLLDRGGDNVLALALGELRAFRGGHHMRVNSLAWNNHIITTGGMDAKVINNDVRIREHIVETFRGHQQEVCGLKWSPSSQQLASGGNDNLLFIWDRSMTSSNSPTHWLHRLQDHRAAVKALAWRPFQTNLLVSGGGGNDRFVLSSGTSMSENCLALWKYQSMVKMAEVRGHNSRVLFMTQSPDGYTAATAAGDETLPYWNVFGDPQGAKPAPKANAKPFANYPRPLPVALPRPLGDEWLFCSL